MDRHVFRGRLNYVLFRKPVEKAKSWLHRITAPDPPSSKHPPIKDGQVVEDIAVQRHYSPAPVQTSDSEPTGEAAQTVKDEVLSGETERVDNSDADMIMPLPERDEYDEDEEYMRHMADSDVESDPQAGEVDAQDFLVLLSVFSKKQHASQGEIETARRAMRALSGSEVEQSILDQLNGKDGYIALMLDMIAQDLSVGDNRPLQKMEKSEGGFRLEDFV